jgi:multiple sugar transport system substrate-binding protein
MIARFHKKNRILSILMVFAIVAGVVTACTEAEPEPTATTAPVEATAEPATAEPTAEPAPSGCPDFGEVTLNVMSVGEAYASAFRMYEQEFADQYGISFTYDFSNVEDAFRKIVSDFALGTSFYDIVLFQPANLPSMSPYLAKVQPYADKYGLDFAKDDWIPRVWSLYNEWDGEWLAMPFDIDVVHIMYYKPAFEREENKTKFEEEYGYALDVPKTWDEYADIATFFNGWDWMGDGRVRYGTAETWAAGWNWYMFQPRFANYGGQYFDENMNPMINTEAGLDALNNMLASKDGQIDGVTNFKYADQRTMLSKGDIAMLFSWSSLAKFAELNEASEVAGEIGYAQLPGAMVNGELIQRASLVGGWSFGVPEFAPNKDAAMCAVWFLSQPDMHLEIASTPGTAVDSGTISSFAEGSMQCELFEAGDEFCEISRVSVETGYPEMYIIGRPEYVEAINYEIGEVINSGKDPQQALDDAAKEWDAITDRLGREDQIEDWAKVLEVLEEMGLTYIPRE